MQACCFFGLGTPPDDISEEDFELRLCALAQGIFARGITHFVTGLRPGVDSLCAKYVHSLLLDGARLRYVAGRGDLKHALLIIGASSHMLAVYEDPFAAPAVQLAIKHGLTLYALSTRQLIDRDSELFTW